jgi:translocation and assembly module TamB
LVAILIVVVALIHIPLVQRQITKAVADNLSNTVGADVQIKAIYFSVFGNVTVEGLAVFDPEQNPVFAAQQIEVGFSILNLISGDLIFDEVRLAVVEGNLIQGKDGLNIDFIVEAFKSEEPPSAEPSDVQLVFNDILLKDIKFRYTSEPDGMSVDVNLGDLIVNRASFSSGSKRISVGKAGLSRTLVEINTTTPEDKVPVSVVSPGDSTSEKGGIAIVAGEFTIDDSKFSLHKDSVFTTRKFDPAHLELANIRLRLANFLMNSDSLEAQLQSLSVAMPGFVIDRAAADLHWHPDQFTLSNFLLASAKSQIKVDVKGVCGPALAFNLHKTTVNITATAHANPSEISYFVPDSSLQYFRHWTDAALSADINYAIDGGTVRSLSLKTGNSQVSVAGVVDQVLDADKISWKDAVVDASIGADFRQTLTSLVRGISLPPDATLRLKTSGNTRNMVVDVGVSSAWGGAAVVGKVSPHGNTTAMDMRVTTSNLHIGKWINQASLGSVDLTASVTGVLGGEQGLTLKGLIENVGVIDHAISQVAFDGWMGVDTAAIKISIADTSYRADIHSELSFGDRLIASAAVEFNQFKLGELLSMDTTLDVTGFLKTSVVIDDSSMQVSVLGDHMMLENPFRDYPIDTLVLRASMAPHSSDVEYFNGAEQANLSTNFDIRQVGDFIQNWSGLIRKRGSRRPASQMNRALNFDIHLENAHLFQLAGLDVRDFSMLSVTGKLNEQNLQSELKMAIGEFSGYGLGLDTLEARIGGRGDSLSVAVDARKLSYDSMLISSANLEIVTRGDTAMTKITVANDTTTMLSLAVGILPDENGMFVYPGQLQSFGKEYIMTAHSPVYVGNGNVTFNHFNLAGPDMDIKLHGDTKAFDLSVRHINLTPLNYVIAPDSAVVTKGYLTGDVSYRRDERIVLMANVDSLQLYSSSPFQINASANTTGGKVPFEFLVSNASNKIGLKGDYNLSSKTIDAAFGIDISQLELFSFLASDFFEKMNGRVVGDATIKGPLKNPNVNGFLQFQEVGIRTLNPQLAFRIANDSVKVKNSSILFDDFSVYDQENKPLTINGRVDVRDPIGYDLEIISESFALFNKPDSASGPLRGTLVIGSNIKLKGSAKNTDIEAALTVKDATRLTLVTASEDIELLAAEGIVEFVEPALLLDTVLQAAAASFYDSLIASLPEFNLNSAITVEENAKLRVVIDEHSGDYIELSGAANLDLGYDRTGNLTLSGNYVVKQGVYRVSFYDLVKKNFTLVEGSSISWTGDPQNGDLNIKAAHTVESNSIGLVGHEIGENEKSVYKRSLDYEVGININGTIEKPIISFSLDLPAREKASYPVLANKLDRLRQPEYESELNKQVFGLLVLGGFIPESSGADINSNQIAATAVANSVNSLLASQLNRFASQYVKGVSIDVGIQSYSDYSAPGGKTQTAMDFRVTKSVMNDRLSFEVGGDFDINTDQSGANTGTKNYRGDIAIIYDLTGNGDKQLKLFNNETYDIIYQEIRNTGISLIFIREFSARGKNKEKRK